MTKITTDFVGTESAATTRNRLSAILAYYNFTPHLYSTWGNARADINQLLFGTPGGEIGPAELAGTFLPKFNLINAPADLIVARLFGAGENGRFSGRLEAAFSDTAGTTPSVFGTQQVARVNSRIPSGASWQQATAAARPAFGRAPVSVRNRANGSAAPTNDAFWNPGQTVSGITITRVATGSDADGPWADFTVVGTATMTLVTEVMHSIASRTQAAVGQTWTASVRAWRVAGAAPPATCGARVDVFEEIAPSTENGVSMSSLSAGPSPTMLTTSRTIANGGTNQVRARIGIRTGAGDSVNYTLRVQAVQFEQGSARTAYQANVSQFDITESGFPAFPFARFDLSDDALATTIATGGTFDVLVPGRISTRIARGLVIGDGQELRIGPTRLNVAGSPVGPVGLLAATGDLVDAPLVVSRTITPAEIALLMIYYTSRGAGPFTE